MQQFFKGLQKGDVETERKLSEVMKGGKNDIKRATAVDITLYGTEEGVEAKKRYEDEKVKKNKRKQKNTQTEVLEHKMMTINKESVIQVAAVGTVVAAIVAILIGGNRSR